MTKHRGSVIILLNKCLRSLFGFLWPRLQGRDTAMLNAHTLQILTESAKYDVSCSSSGSKRANRAGGLGNASVGGICHSFTPDGRCISLLKILMSNECLYDCEYCPNRRSSGTERARITPDEVCRLTINFYKRNYIEGLFLS